MEVWKDVIGFERHYQISNYGNIRSKARQTKNQYSDEFIKVKGTINNAGYEVQNLYINNTYKTVSDEVVLSIREDVKTMPGKEVAVKYNISPATVSWIKNRKGNYAD